MKSILIIVYILISQNDKEQINKVLVNLKIMLLKDLKMVQDGLIIQ